MTIYQGWRITHVPANLRYRQFVATYAGRTLVAATMTSLQRKIEAAMEEAFT